jgi:hypothetical protein
MIIPPEQISHQLAETGFRFSYFSSNSGNTVLARRVGPSLFERVSVSRGRQRQDRGWIDRVSADVQCTVVPGWTAVKGLGVSEYLRLPSSDATGHSTILEKAAAFRWVAELATAAPAAAVAARIGSGAAILESTSVLRSNCEAYLSKVPPGTAMSERVDRLRAQATAQQRSESDAWRTQKVVIIPDGAIWYEAACLLIAIHQDDVEGERGRFVGKRADDIQDRGLMLRLQYLASRLANEPGWDWPIVG